MPNNTPKRKKIVVMSDLHFGAQGCILAKWNEEYITRLVRQIGGCKPEEIILLGDVFDFFLSSLKGTFSTAKVFFNELSNNKDLAEVKVTYIPGNHDHHIWSLIVENEYILKRLTRSEEPPDRDEYVKNFVTNDRNSPEVPQFLRNFHKTLEVVYPYTMRQCGSHRYHFTHGHLQDDIFTRGSDAKEPETLAELAAFNAFWIEGGWFYLGQAGRLTEEIVKRYESESWLDYVGAFGMGGKALFTPVWKRGKELLTGPREVTPRAATPGYIKEYVAKPYIRELLPFTFIYGHTHEQKVQVFTFKDKELNLDRFTTINTGAWLAKKEEDKKNNGFLLIEEEKPEPEWVPFWKKRGTKWVPFWEAQ